jgi:HD-like signal output (HDOD) protein
MEFMSEIDLFKFYTDVLVPVTPVTPVNRILEIVMQGGETNDDFAKLLALDSELQHWVRLTVQRLGFEKQASHLEQAITLLGQNRIRDLLIGRHIERAFVKPENTVMGKILAEQKKIAQEAALKNPTADKTHAGSAEPKDDNLESIPQLQDFNRYLEYANAAENIAISIRNSYPGQAFAGGVIFDYVYNFLASLNLSGLTDSRLKVIKTYMDETFRDGLRSGIAANEIMQKISIPHQKNVFVTSLVHNIGKPLLMAFDPVSFEKSFHMSSGNPAKPNAQKIRSEDAENEIFDWDHGQIGSLYIGRLPFLAEIERSIDYHHNPHLLKFSNPKLYALAAILSVSGGISKLYEKSRHDDPDVDKIRDQRLTASEDFLFLKLNERDWFEIKSNYALKLMKVGL